MKEQMILERWETPLFRGQVASATHTGFAENRDCGDSVSLDIRVENGIMMELKHAAKGCVLCIVSADLLCEHLTGKPVGSKVNIFELLGGTALPNREQCCRLAGWALRSAYNGST